jgi:hypothetical protein
LAALFGWNAPPEVEVRAMGEASVIRGGVVSVV